MSRFPKLSETFVLYEMLALEELGVDVEIFPLLLEREAVHHREAARLAARAHRARIGSLIGAQWWWLRRRPRAYLASWRAALTGNARSPAFFLRALAVVPVAALFARRMRELRVEHIHAHWATHPALAAFVASRLTGIPYSFTAHAHDIYVNQSMLREKMHAARFVVTISEFNRRFLTGRYGPTAADRLVVLHCGTDPALFRPVPATAEEPTTIVTVASLQPQKGHRYLVEACRLLTTAGHDLRCLFVGDGRERADLERQIADAGLRQRVLLLGNQPRHRVIELVGEAHLVVQPSVVLPNGKMEGIPVALMEALAMERAVVATDISGVSELVEDGVTGLLVPPGDPAALAAAIERLVRDPALRHRLGAAGRDRVRAEFDLAANTRQLAERFFA
jgi:glycosyltransferase involved in cell wall biosynthesis